MCRLLVVHSSTDDGFQLSITDARPHSIPQADLIGPKQAHLQRPVSQQPQAVAVTTECMSHAGDKTHAAFEPWECEVLGDLTGRIFTANQALMEPANGRK